MARLTIEQVKAPDFSASSEMLARAGESFNTGVESAKGILDKYNQGQQAKGDQALIGALAGLKSEDELSNFLQTTDLTSVNISDKMKENILGARATILGNNSTRQSTLNNADSNSRANAAEGRTAAEYLDGVVKRDEMRGLTSSYIGALQEGQQYGSGGGLNDREILAKTIEAEARGEGYTGKLAVGAVVRNRAATGKYGGSSITDVIMKDGQFSAWNGETGYAGGEGAVDMRNLRVSDESYAAADAVLSGQYEDPTGGATHYYNPDKATPAWGRGQNPSANQWSTIGNHVFGNPDGIRPPGSTGPVQGYDPSRVTSNNVGGQKASDFLAAVSASTKMTPDEASKLLTSVLDQQRQGDAAIQAANTAIKEAEAAGQAQALADATRSAILNTNNLSGDAVTREILSFGGASPSAVLEAAGQNRDKFGGVISPNVPQDQQVTDALGRTSATDATQVSNDPIVRSFEMAKSFDSSKDLGKDLMSEFNVPTDSGLDSVYVEKTITRMANDAGVTPGQMAATLSQTSQGNFQQFNDMLGADPGTEFYSSIMSLSNNNFGQEASASYEAIQSDASKRSTERASAELQLSAASSRAVKFPVGSEQRVAADAEVAALKDTLLKGMTPQEREQNLRDYVVKTGMGSRLQGLDPNSPEFFRAMAQLEETVKADTSLTPNEKELLLRDIRG
jgi:hypothetical protein